jgi:hypothetical protein
MEAREEDAVDLLFLILLRDQILPDDPFRHDRPD